MLFQKQFLATSAGKKYFVFKILVFINSILIIYTVIYIYINCICN